MIFWRLWITDCGYGMRIFLFAGCMGLFSSLILGKIINNIGKKSTTINHIRFISDYYYQAINLIGSIIIWCLLPVLNWSDLWHNSNLSGSTDIYILHVVSLNMWFALCGSVIGSVCVCILLYRKLSIHTLVFSIFSVLYILNIGWYRIFLNFRSVPKPRCCDGSWNFNLIHFIIANK
jgi:hypothetical protein